MESPCSEFGINSHLDGATIAPAAVGAGVTGLVSASDAKTMRLCDPESARPLDSHTGVTLFSAGLRDSDVVARPDATSWVTSVAFSPDGKLIVAGSYDNTVRVWDSKSGEKVAGPLDTSFAWTQSNNDGHCLVEGGCWCLSFFICFFCTTFDLL
ncbi:hypothetical protein B0H10DRAFT_774812 [Mycena sp. CBHHK59/15]|nr:hypothetical protein B0H10DRAFT_774812 [Mycena sp. CBHHK59/15]